MAGTFEIKDTFYMNGKPFQILSGSIHYFRIVPQYWRDRLEKLKAMGLNTVETYIPWNVHEPKKGAFLFDGMADVVSFVKLAGELGLYVILRPSPYICAEWEFGGLPGWLLAEKEMQVRSSSPAFLRHVKEYYEVLLPLLKPLQITEGGNVILMQVENEYGYFADDAAYLETIKKLLQDGGINVPLITSDEPGRAADVRGVLGGLVRSLGQRRTYDRQPEGKRRGSGRDGAPWACQYLYVYRRDELWLYERFQLLRSVVPGCDFL